MITCKHVQDTLLILLKKKNSMNDIIWLLSEWKLLSYVQLFVTPRAVACQVPLSMGFSRPEYWSG